MIANIRPQFNWIDKKTLLIPREGEGGYQRPIYQAAGNNDPDKRPGGGLLVVKMRRNLSWTLFGALTVVRRPTGDLVVLDGGHRMEAIRHMDSISEVPCLIYGVNSLQEEAEIFRAINRMRTQLGVYDDHRAAVVQQEGMALKIDAAIASMGRRPARITGPTTINCLRSIRVAMRKDEKTTLSMLGFLGELCHGHALDQYILGAFIHAEQRLQDRKTPLSLAGVYRKAVIDTGCELIAREIRREIIKGEGPSKPSIWARGAINAINQFSKAGIMLDPPGRPRKAKPPVKAVEIRSQIGQRHNGGSHAAA